MSNVSLGFPDIHVQLFPKEAYTTDWMLLFRITIPAYLVMSLSQFVTYLLILMVREKESRIKETLYVAGLHDIIWWFSWFTVYAVFVILLAIIATVCLFQLRVFQNSNVFLIFFLILLYGISIIFFCFMLIPFLNNHKSAGIIGKFLVNSISFLYFVRIFMDKVDAKFLWFLSLLSPSAFTFILDKALTMDLAGDGIGYHNLWEGPGLSFGNGLMMLFYDIFLYAVLTYYFDLVIPISGGNVAKRKLLFFLQPLVHIWMCIFQPYATSRAKTYMTTNLRSNNDIEPIPNHLKNKVGIEIVDVQKLYQSSCRSPPVAALNGINLTIYEGQITAILGHNGAGKTTLFNILTGLTAPSSGTAFIFGHDIRKSTRIQVRRLFGFCPQHNVLYKNLTPREHLKLYCAIRGVPFTDEDYEVTSVLKDINLVAEADIYSKYLTDGQKRRLSVGLAIIGSPKVLIFDEPTAGVDLLSRRSMWFLLQKYKAGKVVLLTTHFMDEADMLADRKAVISKGAIKCVGSSLFLKNKFGIGYHLTLVLERNNTYHEVYKLVRRYVPEAELAHYHGKELSIILPHHSVAEFGSLFKELETEVRRNGNQLGISSYGISMTTLEEVFLYLEKCEDLESQESSTIGNRVLRHRIEGQESRSIRQSVVYRRIQLRVAIIFIMPISSSSNSTSEVIGIDIGAIEIHPDAKNIIKVMFKLRALNFLRDPGRLIILIFVPLLFTTVGLQLFQYEPPKIKNRSLTLNESTYFNGSIVIQESNQTDLLHFMDSTVNWRFENKPNFIDIKPNIGAVTSLSCCDKISISIVCNDTAVHSLPIILNMIDNTFYRKLTKENVVNSSATEKYKIIVKSFPFVAKSQSVVFDRNLVFIAVGLGLQFMVIPIIFASDFVFDREMKTKNLLRVNGLPFWIYYGTFFILWVIVMQILESLHLLILHWFDLVPFRQSVAFGMLIFLLYLHSPCAILFGSVLSYFFETAETTQTILMHCTTLVGIIPFGLVICLDLLKFRMMYTLILHTIFSMLDSFYLPFAIVYFVGRVHSLCLSNEACTYIKLKDYLSPEIVITITSCCLQIPIFLLILHLLEHWKSNETEIPVYKENKTLTNTDINEEHDSDDVKFEKYRVANFLASETDSPDYPLIISQNMKKIYRQNQNSRKNFDCTFFQCRQRFNENKEEQNVKPVLTGLTFAVGPGEIFGLLGHNGAGKSTALKIITNEELPDEGTIRLKGYNLLVDGFKRVSKHIGYCPQDDVLWRNTTVREHIELYATIRGIPSEKIEEVTNSYLAGLQMMAHADKFTAKCSGGTRRKLSFAIAMVGSPSLVLIDEPSTGMDPHSKRFMWDTILCSFQGSRSAILTTHAMEEADAVCSRVGIMVNGKLKCVGSTQQLKDLYGAWYTLEVKINSDNDSSAEKEEKVRQFMNEIFPLATLEETFSDHLMFKIPQSVVKSLAYCFIEIEKAKQSLSIEEYSFSQTTLEQIFFKFSHADARV